ncbi:hypothetical protein SMMN14_07385 [Sphaerulina musiva]
MFPSMQPHRPQNPLHHGNHQQQTRPVSDSAPKNQIEAMPPNTTSTITTASTSTTPPPPHHPLPLFNPATTHPVFFMTHWRKPPFPLPLNPALSPVAAGYVFPHHHLRPTTAGNTKL